MRINPSKMKYVLRARRKRRIRGKIFGTQERPRLSVFRSSKHVVLQLINDEAGRTLISVSSMPWKKGRAVKTELALSAGRSLAEKARASGVRRVVFDRGGYAYHGRVRAAAQGAREGGLE